MATATIARDGSSGEATKLARLELAELEAAKLEAEAEIGQSAATEAHMARKTESPICNLIVGFFIFLIIYKLHEHETNTSLELKALCENNILSLAKKHTGLKTVLSFYPTRGVGRGPSVNTLTIDTTQPQEAGNKTASGYTIIIDAKIITVQPNEPIETPGEAIPLTAIAPGLKCDVLKGVTMNSKPIPFEISKEEGRRLRGSNKSTQQAESKGAEGSTHAPLQNLRPSR